LVTGFVLAALVIGGCGQNMAWQVTDPGVKKNGPVPAGNCQEQYDLLLPDRIDILPFTKPKSWDNDQKPDGIEVVLRPLDSFGDQTKAIGLFRFELFLYKTASSDSRGPRIGFWEENLNSRDAQYKHWDRITRTYRFRLGWSGQQVRPGKYVLEVTYIAPSGQRLSDTYIMEARPSREQVKEKLEKQRQGGLKLF
jgi:hypothetical protein